MHVKSAEFVLSAPKLSVMPEATHPELAFVGRSNVGKSSLMNMLLGRKNLVKTSSTPGKTQALNYFLINNDLYLVDMPGYGYAKVPLKTRDKWRPLAEGYLLKRATLALVVALVDARHPPTKDDMAMLDWLLTNQVPTIVALTKIDKIPKTKRAKHVNQALETLAIDRENLIPCSAVERFGKKEIWAVAEDAIADWRKMGRPE